MGARAVNLHLVVHVRLGLEPVAGPHEPKRRQHLRGARVLLTGVVVAVVVFVVGLPLNTLRAGYLRIGNPRNRQLLNSQFLHRYSK